MNLEIITGPMFSGKSTELIRRAKLHKLFDKKILVVKPLIDTRSSGELKTHDGKTYSDNFIETSELLPEWTKEYQVILLDEVQFFTNLTEFITAISHINVTIIIAGLVGDAKQQPFGQIAHVLQYACKIDFLQALCMVCRNGNYASFSKSLEDFEGNINIGANDKYIAVCTSHFN